MLRKVRGPRWGKVDPDDASNVAKAADDLRLREGETGLSVSKVTEEEAKTFALHWVSIHQDSIDKAVDFLLVPEELIPPDLLTVTPDGSGDELLEARHREVIYQGAFTPETLAESVLRGECKPFRLSRTELQADAERRTRGAP